MDVVFNVALVFLVIAFVVCLIISHKNIRNQTKFGKRFFIGKDSPETIDNLTKYAEDILSGNSITIKDLYSIKIIAEDGEITKVTVENDKTVITLPKEGEKIVHHKTLSEKGATVYAALSIWTHCLLFALLGMIIAGLFLK